MSSMRIQATLEDPVALHMRTDFAQINVNQTTSEAMSTIRTAPPSGRVIYFYVVDDCGRLEGVVPTRRLLLSPPERRIAEIMVKEVIALPQRATVLDACEFFIFHRLLAFPVVDKDRRILGVVDIELYTNELIDIELSKRTDDLFQLSASTLPRPGSRRRSSPFAIGSPGFWPTSAAALWLHFCRVYFRRSWKRSWLWRCSFRSCWRCPRA